MSTYILNRDNMADLKFEGELISEVSSEAPGKPDWMYYRLYKTKAGKYVLLRVKVIRDGEEHEKVVVCKDVPTLVQACHLIGRLGKLAKQLLRGAGIQPVEEIE